ncbi:type IV toxin-antitoxin system AbiEi family antitoxin domain-containing protein [Nocardioides donggukensis]|uniref:Type IV toxin-antitoxin system AbiEi family antitoxin domain-containing protein n=1 Tax=Nocardioides donggukensis TaxID=2774019 RepID=A0A927Q149_9ACTN|nr:type IV toxin-antitoxin system AbiEi family antitoxin domain-containing protein [Nocardioides donggukensis]MBD8869129.1 hypothetical protein [Nocardioides donggukensis]
MLPRPMQPWLDPCASIPDDRPFTRAQARAEGVHGRQLLEWTRAGLLAHPIHGVYHARQLPDSLGLRLAVLRLVVPEDAVVTDRTAAWLLGAPMALAPGDHLVVPRVSMFRPPGYRLRNGLAASGERMLDDDEITEIDGIRVTTPLRTACDLGRLLHRDQAMAGLDQMLRVSRVGVETLVAYSGRFRGRRGMRQLRCLAPLADPRAQSPGESILRLRWVDCSDLPRPTPQLAVPGPGGLVYFLDLGVEGLRYAAEYDGAEWHGPDRRAHDQERRRYLAEQEGYLIDVLRAENIHGPHQNAELVLRAGIARVRKLAARR